MIEITILGSGSSGNSIAIKHDNSVLLVDAGFSGIELVRRLEKAAIDVSMITGILISHEHDDHIQGARIFAKRLGNIAAYANSLTAERLRMMKKAPASMNIFANGSPFTVGPFTVDAFSVCHDAVDPVGFIIRCENKKIGIATDLGHAGKMVPMKLCDAQLIVLESNHDPELLRQSNRPPQLQHRIRGRRGHLSNDGAANLLPDLIGPLTKYLVLAHVSDDCNDNNLIKKVIGSKLKEMEREDIDITIARQHEISKTFVI